MARSGGGGAARRSGQGAQAPFGQRGLEARGIEDDQRLGVGQRRLGALVGVDTRLAEAVVASPGGEVVDRLLKAIAAQEPFEGANRIASVALVPRGEEGLDLCFDERRGVERLLVAVVAARLTAAPAAVPGQLQ